MRIIDVARTRFGRALLLAAGTLCLSTASLAQIDVSVDIAPPELPVYEQPMCPGDGYIWTPGYWAWGDGAYYWVSGDWVMAPETGFLWTPGYWGWRGGGYFFNAGYWGLGVGFYGGINYGFGYFGRGYDGGRWDNGHFFYNTAYNRVNGDAMHNVYNARVNEAAGGRVSYNGGRGGIEARATPQEESVAKGRHAAPVAAQTQHAQAARSESQQRASGNGHAAAGERSENGARSGGAVHPKDLPAVAHSAPPNTGNSKLDQKYQKQQDQLGAKQNQERQKLQQQQDKEHQQQGRQQASQARTQQMEQRHQQQTQQLQQRHTQQSQQMQQRQSSGGGQSRGGGGGRH